MFALILYENHANFCRLICLIPSTKSSVMPFLARRSG